MRTDEIIRNELHATAADHFRSDWIDVERRAEDTDHGRHRRRTTKYGIIGVAVLALATPAGVVANSLLFDPANLDLDPLATPACGKVWSDRELATWLREKIDAAQLETTQVLPASIEVRGPASGGEFAALYYVTAVGAPAGGTAAPPDSGMTVQSVGGIDVAVGFDHATWLSKSGQIRMWLEAPPGLTHKVLDYFTPLIATTASSDPRGVC
jgi:hypothetical protein